MAERASRLTDWSARFLDGLAGDAVDDPLLPAVLHTIRVFDLDLEDFRKFLASMAMDLTVSGYATYDDLLGYMEGSAAVIGTMMLPILESSDPAAAREPARQLGLAFQLTNFVRDVAEDLDLGRVYLPGVDLARFGVTPADLKAARVAGGLTADVPAHAIRELIAYEVERARNHYRLAAPGVPLLAPASQGCIRAAYRLYGGILDEVEKLDYDVFAARARVPRSRRLAVALASVATPPGTPVPLPGPTSTPTGSRGRRPPWPGQLAYPVPAQRNGRDKFDQRRCMPARAAEAARPAGRRSRESSRAHRCRRVHA